MKIDTTYIDRCFATLDKAYSMLKDQVSGTIEYDMYRSACVKEFEIILEQSGKLLKKQIRQYSHSAKPVDMLVFKDVFRHASLHNIIGNEAVERWLEYRDNRNVTAHDHGVNFAEENLVLLPIFIKDAKDLIFSIKTLNEQ